MADAGAVPYIIDYAWIAVLVLSFWALGSVVMARGLDVAAKFVWAIVSFVPLLGPALWFFVGRRAARAARAPHAAH